VYMFSLPILWPILLIVGFVGLSAHESGLGSRVWVPGQAPKASRKREPCMDRKAAASSASSDVGGTRTRFTETIRGLPLRRQRGRCRA
jgi:hypothetical protein